ncbi:hypothetical protein SAMN05444481_12828 [Flavobacterium frigidimaris]|nr:hypothetical protein SAMN05444481_12828 [Flavobacterium frigidimaris]
MFIFYEVVLSELNSFGYKKEASKITFRGFFI